MWEGSQEDNRGLLPLVSAGRSLRGGFKSPGGLNSVCTEGLGARGDEEGAAGSEGQVVWEKGYETLL